ncbi:putative ferric-chelate reductase 1 [Gambusia affinis]|nr:putative ferric-chelate reductase 1 [Gambusia affinis]
MEHKMMQVFAAMMVFLALSFQPVLSQADISKTGCGTTKQCVQQPDSCDPTTTSCLFGSARPTVLKPPNGVDLAFELSGNVPGVNSSEYIAVGLTNEAQINFMLFICALNNNSGNATFFNMSTVYNRTSNTLNSTNAKPMTDVKNTINGTSIKCTFNVAGLNTTTDAALVRAADTTYRMVVGSGTVDGNGLVAFTIAKIGNAIDLSSFPNSTNTTATGGANRPFYSNAVLPLLSFLTLSILTFA